MYLLRQCGNSHLAQKDNSAILLLENQAVFGRDLRQGYRNSPALAVLCRAAGRASYNYLFRPIRTPLRGRRRRSFRNRLRRGPSSSAGVFLTYFLRTTFRASPETSDFRTLSTKFPLDTGIPRQLS